MPQITIRQHPYSEDHSLCSLQTRGYQYSCTWANVRNEKGELISPNENEVLEAWEENPKSFDRYSVKRGY